MFEKVEKFLIEKCPSGKPLLLALSGGPDSLFLFYALLYMQKHYGIDFHIAHVDHGWRAESKQEAKALQLLADQHRIPFHLKKLTPELLKGNLEAACREERYHFFSCLCNENPFQAVLTGHHQDDLAETVFKRLMEGCHWSCLTSLQAESTLKGIRLLRPLLGMKKKEILSALDQYSISSFDDPTNRDFRFLRSRMRETIFPHLNQEFGKEVQNSLVHLSEEAKELSDYFNEKSAPILRQIVLGPFGSFLDLQSWMPMKMVELKYLIRLLSCRYECGLSREMIAQAAEGLKSGKANLQFATRSHRLWIDRQRIFIQKSASMDVERGWVEPLFPSKEFKIGEWKGIVSEVIDHRDFQVTSWKEAWKGSICYYLPQGNYQICFPDVKLSNLVRVKKRWSDAKVPAFLYDWFPLIISEGRIEHEFLSGRGDVLKAKGLPCWKVELSIGPADTT